MSVNFEQLPNKYIYELGTRAGKQKWCTCKTCLLAFSQVTEGTESNMDSFWHFSIHAMQVNV